MGNAEHKEEGLHERWAELLLLRQSAPDTPAKGQKPSEATVAALKAYKVKEKSFLGELSKEGAALLKRYEKAVNRPARITAGGGGHKQAGEQVQRDEVPSRVKWINDDAPHFWSQRLACDHLVTGWDDVARLFGLAIDAVRDGAL